MIHFLVLQLSGNKILGLAKFFLGIGIPGNSKNFFNQMDSLACLDSNRQELAWIAPMVFYLLHFLLIIIYELVSTLLLLILHLMCMS